MGYSTTTAAVAALIRNTSEVTSLLGHPVNSVIGTGQRQLGMVSSYPTPVPFIEIQMGEELGGRFIFPFSEEFVNLWVFDNAVAPNEASYLRINEIIEACRYALHKTTLSITSSYFNAFEMRYDGYSGKEMWDDVAKMPFRIVRFRIYGIHATKY